MITALLGLAAVAGYVSVKPGILNGHFYRTDLLGLTHVFTTGWITLMATGVLVRLSPMIWNIPPCNRALGFTFLALWVVGASGLIMHMSRGEWFGVWTSAICFVVAVLLLIPLHRHVWRRARAGDWIARYAAAAVFHLFLAACLGLFIGLNRHLGWFELHTIRTLSAHVHLAVAGFVTFMIFGFGRRLHPTLAPARGRDRWETPFRFWGLELGTLGLSAALLFFPPAVFPTAVLLFLALGAHLARPIARVLSGRSTDPAGIWVGVALTILGANSILGLVLAWPASGLDVFVVDRLRFAYGFLALTGWTTLAMTSFAHKILPLWVWEDRFKQDLGKQPVPPMRGLHRVALLHCSGFAQAAGSLSTALGLCLGLESFTTWGFRIFSIGIALFMVNFVLMVRWSWLGRAYTPSASDRERFESVYQTPKPHR